MKLTKKTKLDQKYERYDLQIKGTHTFVAEGVVVHNTNCRLGYMHVEGEEGEQVLDFVAGSHNTRRKSGQYWLPYDLYPQLKVMMENLWKSHQTPIIVYGEIFGPGVQDMQYGLGKADFRVFDISIDGTYLSWGTVHRMCVHHQIPTVTPLYVGPYSRQVVEDNTDGPSTMFETSEVKALSKQIFTGREGIVIKPATERDDPTIGRVILKSVSADYLARKNPKDGH